MKPIFFGLAAAAGLFLSAPASAFETLHPDPSYPGAPQTYNGGQYTTVIPDEGGGTSIIYGQNGESYTCYTHIHQCHSN